MDVIESEALKIIGSKNKKPWWRLPELLTHVPESVLRRLDTDGLIEFQGWTLQNLTNHPNHPQRKPTPSSLGWISLISKPAVYGRWDSVCGKDYEDGCSPEIRVTDKGRAELDRIYEREYFDLDSLPPGTVRDARARRMKAKRGSFEAQKLVATEKAEVFIEQAAKSSQPELVMFYKFASEAFIDAMALAKMSRTDDRNADQFVIHHLRLVEFLSRAEAIRVKHKAKWHWPTDPGITFSWKAGQSAIEVGLAFAASIETVTLFTRNRPGEQIESLPVSPVPDKYFEEWLNRFVAELRDRTLEPVAEWPMWKMLRDEQSLLWKMRGEYQKAQGDTELKDADAGNLTRSAQNRPKGKARRGGSVPKYDPVTDAKLKNDFKASQMTKKDFALARNIPYRELFRALDRTRK